MRKGTNKGGGTTRGGEVRSDVSLRLGLRVGGQKKPSFGQADVVSRAEADSLVAAMGLALSDKKNCWWR